MSEISPRLLHHIGMDLSKGTDVPLFAFPSFTVLILGMITPPTARGQASYHKNKFIRKILLSLRV